MPCVLTGGAGARAGLPRSPCTRARITYRSHGLLQPLPARVHRVLRCRLSGYLGLLAGLAEGAGRLGDEEGAEADMIRCASNGGQLPEACRRSAMDDGLVDRQLQGMVAGVSWFNNLRV